MSFARMGLLFLNKKRLRTALTIVAVVLGVGILTGVNVTADSIDSAIRVQVYARLGNTDVIVRSNRSIQGGWFPYAPARDQIQDVAGVREVVPRVISTRPTHPRANRTSGLSTVVVGLDKDDPAEQTFGTCNITAALDPALVNTSNLEAAFRQFATYQFPVVVSRDYARRFDLQPGDGCFIYPEAPTFFGGGMQATNTSTWFNATVVAVIDDTSEAVRDFTPPARVWELSPPGLAVYVDLETAWAYIFNAHRNQVNMVFVQCDDPSVVNPTRERLEALDLPAILPGGLFTENVKALFTEGILQVNFLMRGLFSIFSGISLLVSAIIIKNLLEMAKEEQIHQIGVMRAMGVTKSKILVLYLSQILFISVVGSVGGLVFGYFLSSFFVGSYVDSASALGANFGSYAIEPVMTGTTVLVGMAAGVLVSLVFGFLPARAAANVDPLEALRASSTKSKRSLAVRTIRKTGSLTLSAGMLVTGVVIIGSAFGGLFLLDVINPTVIALLFGGVILLVVGIVLLAALLFPLVVPALSSLFVPLLRKMRTITSRNLRRYSRQTKNTFAMLAIGLCMMITVGTIMNSAFVGAYPGGRTITGGDISLGDLSRGHVPKEPHAAGLRDLSLVDQAVPVRFSVGFEGITRIQRLATNQTFGGTADSLLGPVREAFHLGIVDPAEYARLHARDSIVELAGHGTTLDETMAVLAREYTIILQDRLARRLGGVQVGEVVRLRFEGFEADFQVVGVFEILPGFQTTYYATDNARDKQFSGAISWQTYTRLVDDNLGKADIVARNQFVPPENYSDYLADEALWGYVHTPVDYRRLESLAYQTGLVQGSTRRVHSLFWGAPRFQWDANATFDPARFTRVQGNASTPGSPATNASRADAASVPNRTTRDLVLWEGDGALDPTWNDLFSRAVVIDPVTDAGYGNTTITATLPGVPANASTSVEAVLGWACAALPNVTPCVVNEVHVNLNISTGAWDYVKRFEPGETIRMSYNESVGTEFVVVATTNAHYPYEYVDAAGDHHGDTAVLNYEALSFNPYTANGTDWDLFFEVLDVEPNTIFLPRAPLALDAGVFESFTAEFVPALLDRYWANLTGALPGLDTNATNGTVPVDSPAETFSFAWLNQSLADLFLFNATPFAGVLPSDDWVANYTYDGRQLAIDGLTVTFRDVRQNFSLSVDLDAQAATLDAWLARNASFTLDNLTSTVIFDLNDSMTVNDVRAFVATMQNACRVVPTLEDVVFFAPDLFLLEESGFFDAYFLVGVPDKGSIDAALAEIESYYRTQGLPWDAGWVKTATENEEDVGGVLGLIVDMFFGVLSFALVSALLGLAISTIISVKKRYAEIGTLRTLGFSSGQILRLVVGEGIITAIYGIVVGVVAGLVVAGLIIGNLPFMIFLPIVFAPPLQLIGVGVVVLVVAAIGASFLPAVSAVRIDIADAIRSKGE